MNETTFRILDALSRNLGRPISINSLTAKIRKLHKTAYYKNIYDKIQELEKQNIIKLDIIGKSSIITLNFNNYHTTGRLAEMELEKERRFLGGRVEMQMFFMDMERIFHGFHINSISIINPEKNISLNRVEFLFILYEPPEKMEGIYETKQESEKKQEREKFMQNEILTTHLSMQQLQKLQKIHNMKLDYLILRDKDFLNLLKETQSNPLKAMLSDQIAFFHPQDYWIEIKMAGGIMGAEETNPTKIPEQDLVYNLSRFGYKEFGSKIKQGKEICLEYIITAVLVKGDIRRVEAIPVLLAKNKPRYNLLIFLCKKYNKLEKLFGLLNIFHKITKNKEAEYSIEILEKLKIKKEKTDEKNIKQKMRLYHAA